MISRPSSVATQAACSIHMQLSHGRHGATARVEWYPDEEGTWAIMALGGWIEKVGMRRLTAALDQLSDLGIRRLLLDCSDLRYIDYGLLTTLVRRLTRFDAPLGRWMVCGLSRHLDDLFHLAGWESHVLDGRAPTFPPPQPVEAPCETAS